MFSVVTTTQRPDLVGWSMERKHVTLLELAVPWKENISDAEHRKETRYEELVKNLRFGFSKPKLNQMIKDSQESAE